MEIASLFYKSVTMFFETLKTLIIIRIFLSYLKVNRKNLITSTIYSITEPILGFSRAILDQLKIDTGIFDFSPVVAFLIMTIIEYILGRVLF